MAFDWREYLKLARFLQKQGGNGFTQEAAFRCAVSRAYFAAYCHARNYAHDRLNFSPAYDARDHTRLRKHFQRQGVAEIATKLDRLRQWRNSCDYEDEVSDISHLLKSAIDQAQKFLTGSRKELYYHVPSG